MDSDTAMENIQLMMPHMKGNGFKAKSKVKGRSSSRAVVFLKVISRMIWKKDTERCTIILQEIILKGNGNKMWNAEWGRWIGLIFDKNMLEIGRVISNKDGVFIYGSNRKVKGNIYEIDTKEIGEME